MAADENLSSRRLLRGRRGALEGLPLYLIILIVVAAIVVAILVGWLSTLQHPGIGSISVDIEGQGDVAVTCNPSAGACTYANGNTGDFTKLPNNCSFSFNSPPGASFVLAVNVNDKNGHPLDGANVLLAPSSGLTDVIATPGLQAISGGGSGGSGIATYTSVSGYVAGGNSAGGTISVSATYSSGGIQTSDSATIVIDPPSNWNC